MNKKTKILIVGYIPPPFGGVESMTKIIVNSNYLKDKFDLLFLRIKTRKESGKRGKISFLNITFAFYNVARLVIKLLIKKPDCIYCSIAQNKTGFLRDSLFIFIGKSLGKKIIVHFHGGAFDLFYRGQSTLFKKYIEFVLKKINKLIVLGELIKKQFENFINKENVFVIYNCIDGKSLDFDTAQNKSSNSASSKILFVGYISKAKGAADLVKAASLIIKNSENKIIFRLIGPIIEKEHNIKFIDSPNGAFEEINRIIENDRLLNSIEIYPNVTNDFKIKSFYDADIFVFPSYSEGFALVILEAMAAGLPIIMSRVGGLMDILKEGENCLFVEPGDYLDLSKKILFLLDNQSLKEKMKQNNIELIKRFFLPERFEKDLEKVLNNTK